MSSTNFILEKVLRAVEQVCHVDGRTLSLATELAADLRLRRLDKIKLALFLEEKFDLELPDADVARFNTVGDIVRYMTRWSTESEAASYYSWISVQ